jgi:ABC-2 type transport system permease protein
MSMQRLWSLLRKEFLVGPRKPFFLWAILMPVALTLLFQGVFGTLFEPKPRLGIVDAGNSEITRAVRQMEGIQLTLLEDIRELKVRVERNDLDAGMVLPAGFDRAVRGGEKPGLEIYIGGESLASNRIILMVTALDLLRSLEGEEAPVTVELVLAGEEGLPISLRLVPLIVFYALAMAGVFVPGSSLVEEKERGTLQAMLVSPVRLKEVLAAKWALGFFFSGFMASATLLLNRAFGPRPLDVLVVIGVAAALTGMIGLLVGVVSRTSTMLFALVKGAGIFLFMPVVFYIFPEWPQWIAKFFPLYWIIEPIWQVSIMGEPLKAVAFELTVASAITLAFIPVILLAGRRREA